MKWWTSLLLLTSIVFANTSESGTTWYNITPLIGKSALVEDMGQAAIAYDHWAVITVFEISDREKTNNYMNDCIQKGNKLCLINIVNTSNISSNDIWTKDNQNQFVKNCMASVSTIKSLINKITAWDRKLDVLTKAYRAKRAIERLTQMGIRHLGQHRC